MEEAFEIKIGRKMSTEQLTESEDEGSEISDLEDTAEIDDEEHCETLNFLLESFGGIAEVKTLGYREFKIDFSQPNTRLVEDETANYQFEYNENDHPILQDPAYFVPFVNYISREEPSLIGTSIFTNLEGGGSLII